MDYNHELQSLQEKATLWSALYRLHYRIVAHRCEYDLETDTHTMWYFDKNLDNLQPIKLTLTTAEMDRALGAFKRSA